ncbi:hypothetical protein MKX03_011168 [Papaver bracteatum]|nr:hypothetical protein MKX03_011168 [Papaver bracteatum]
MGRAFAMACCCGRSPPPPPSPPSPPPSPPPPSPPPPPPSPPPPSPPPPPPSLSPPPPSSPSSDPCPSLEKKCKLEETYVEFHAFNTDKCNLCRSGCRKKCKSMGSTVGKQMCLNDSESSTLLCTCCCKDNTPASRVDYI